MEMSLQTVLLHICLIKEMKYRKDKRIQHTSFSLIRVR